MQVKWVTAAGARFSSGKAERMRSDMRSSMGLFAVLAFAAAASSPVIAADGGWTVTGWNNLGMHCMDSDYSVMSILPRTTRSMRN
jgi:hypothetical protein